MTSLKNWLGAVAVALLAMVGSVHAAETVTYYYTSPQGTVLATADAAGNVLSTADYRPYGMQVLGTPEAGLGYTGHVSDPDSGLTYMQARYYDPLFGRFLSVDTKTGDAGDTFTFGRYSYAGLNPVTNTDPDGRQTVPGSIDWQAPGMIEAWQQTGREVTLPLLADFIPGGALARCAISQCGSGEWAMAAVGAVPGSGTIKEAVQAGHALEDIRGLQSLSKLRTSLNLAQGEKTLARLDAGGQSVLGISGHGQSSSLSINAISKTHAEADVFQQALDKGMTGGKATLYVDRELCRACGANGGVAGMMKQLGYEELRVVTPTETRILVP